MTAGRFDVADARREGRADGAVLLTAKRFMPSLTLLDWARALDLSEIDVQHAVARLKARAAAKSSPPPVVSKKRPAPHRSGPAPCPVPGCTVIAVDRRGLAAHARSHETAVCDRCGVTFNRVGLGPHRRSCTGAEAS